MKNKVTDRILEEILNIENFDIKRLFFLTQEKDILVNAGNLDGLDVLDGHTKIVQNISFQKDWKLYAETDIYTMILKNYHSENRVSIKIFAKDIIFESDISFKNNDICRVKETMCFNGSYKGFVKNMMIIEAEENLEKIFKKLLRC